MKTSRTAAESMALGWYAQKHKLKPELSAHPTYHFVDNKGKQVKVSMFNILADWNAWKKKVMK